MSVLTKAVQLVEVLGASETPVRLGALADDLDLPKSSVHRLLNELADLGLVMRCPDGEYAIGYRLLSWGQLAESRIGLRSVVDPFLRRLRDDLSECTYFFVTEGLDRVCIARSLAEQTLLQPMLPVGSRMLLGTGAAGKLLYAHMDAERQASVRAEWENRSRIVGQNQALFDEILERGWAVSVEEIEPGLTAFAVEVPNGIGGLLGAVTVAGATQRMPEERHNEILSAMMRTASQISSAVSGNSQVA